MTFFENLGKRVSEAAQVVSKKSSELVEVAKINMNISSEEEKIRKIYIAIGKKVYENYCKDAGQSSHFLEECKEIDSHMENIKKQKARLLETKNMKVCPSCGEETDKDAVYCSKCGAKQELSQESVEPAEPSESKEHDYE